MYRPLPRILAWTLLACTACGPSPPPGSDGGGDDGGEAADATADRDSGTSGDDAGRDAGPGSCSIDLEGTSCNASESCTFTEGCLEIRCECHGGAYACQQENTCPAQCPEPAETDCRSPCAGDLSGCLCRCGGPNYSACACEGGEWSCPHCGGGD